jgi:hypothetical protein
MFIKILLFLFLIHQLKEYFPYIKNHFIPFWNIMATAAVEAAIVAVAGTVAVAGGEAVAAEAVMARGGEVESASWVAVVGAAAAAVKATVTAIVDLAAVAGGGGSIAAAVAEAAVEV